MSLNRFKYVRVLTLVVVLVIVGCGGGESPTATPASTATPAATTTPAATATPEATPTPANVVSSLEDVKHATVRIEAQGSFVEPAEGLQLNVAGSGSGFIIDESGIAVTNNHVVTGAAFLQVWLEGESQPRNAKVLGVSECSDLAVIDIDGDGLRYLEWYDGPISAGLDVYTAGFPLGDPQFTLTRGIVSKERADGETSWASVDAVIEHDATINPGNSGGPLVTQDGKVVAVNYATSQATNQYFAIARAEALNVIDQLRAGQDVDSIGVNGEAVNDGEGLSGIWVASVKSGSPADRASVKGGDVILKLEGLVLATDGTMADYCDILRSHDPDDTLSIEVLRFDTQEVLAGQLNGRQLEATFSFAQELGEVEDVAGTTYSGYTVVTDDAEAIQVEIPTEWSDIIGSAWIRDEQVIGAAISASSNLDDFWNTFSTPGIFFGASEVLAQRYDEAAFLDSLTDYSSDCTYDGRFEYEDPFYTGLYDLYTECGGVGSEILNIVAVPESREFIIWVQTQVVSDADLDALDRIIDTFQVVGELPSEEGAGEGSTAGAPVATERFDGSAFAVDYPSEWKESSIDMLGLTLAIFASRELSLEDMQNLDFDNMVSQDPMALVLVVPPDMASDLGFADFDSTIDQFDDTIPEEGAEIIEQGDTTIGGAEGRIVVAKGIDPDLGELGLYLVVAKTDDGNMVVLMGATPGPDINAYLRVFEYMHQSFTFK